MKVSVIIPTYNESENVQILVPKLNSVFEKENIDGRIIIVDDASSDGTCQVLKDMSKESDNIHILERPGKFGIGSAYKDGFKYGSSLNSDIFVEMDADLSHDPAYLPSFLEKLEDGYDVVIGSRYIEHGSVENWNISRRLISRGANILARILLKLRTNDATSGYRAYSRKALDKIDFTKAKSETFVFQVEMVLLCERAGLKVAEVPIKFLDRQFGKSKLKLKEIYIFAACIINLVINYRIKNHD